jgi:hypothetical protein
MEDDRSRKRFLWGVALAWVPGIPIFIGLREAFTGINNSKATGLAAVAGGLAETYFTVGLAATLICEVWAMTLIFRSFSRGHGLRSAFSILTLCMSGLTLILFCLSLWLFWIQSHHKY